MVATDAKLLSLIGDTAGLLEIGEFWHGLIRALRHVVPANFIALNDIGPDPASITVLIEPEGDPELLRLFADLAYQNPLIRRYNETRDGRTTRISDVVSQEEFHELEIYQRVYKPLNVEYQLAFTLPHVKDRILGVAMTRGGMDFSDAEVALIETARPFLIQAYRNATRYSDVLAAATAAKAGALPDVETLQTTLGLTRRQAQALQLVSTGASEREIAARMGVSHRTVQKHLELCYRALGVTSRSAAAAIAWSGAADTNLPW